MKYKFKNVTAARSKVMRAIVKNNTTIEVRLRKALFREGLRYRINYYKVLGNPDIVLIRNKIAIFCDGDFWHGRSWEKRKPRLRNNRKYWIKKIEGNMSRDKENNRKLRKAGWKVLRFWEKDIHNRLDYIVDKVLKCYQGQ